MKTAFIEAESNVLHVGQLNSSQTNRSFDLIRDKARDLNVFAHEQGELAVRSAIFEGNTKVDAVTREAGYRAARAEVEKRIARFARMFPGAMLNFSRASDVCITPALRAARAVIAPEKPGAVAVSEPRFDAKGHWRGTGKIIVEPVDSVAAFVHEIATRAARRAAAAFENGRRDKSAVTLTPRADGVIVIGSKPALRDGPVSLRLVTTTQEREMYLSARLAVCRRIARFTRLFPCASLDWKRADRQWRLPAWRAAFNSIASRKRNLGLTGSANGKVSQVSLDALVSMAENGDLTMQIDQPVETAGDEHGKQSGGADVRAALQMIWRVVTGGTIGKRGQITKPRRNGSDATRTKGARRRAKLLCLLVSGVESTQAFARAGLAPSKSEFNRCLRLICQTGPNVRGLASQFGLLA